MLLIYYQSVPYHLIPGERIPDEVKRIVREEIDSAVEQLNAQDQRGRDEGIHEARKSLKKIRGVLRLVRPELGEIYLLENVFFRDAGRRLAQFRDAGAIIDSLGALRRKYRDELPRGGLASVRRGLVIRKNEAEKQNQMEQVLNGVAGMLRRAKRRVKNWPLTTDGFGAISPGLKLTFRSGKKALARAKKDPRPENYHEWRKRAKDHWYHIRLLEKVWDGTVPAYERRVKDLETWLGDDHNLVVLEEQVKSEPNYYGQAPEIALFTNLVDRYHRELREQALTLGALIYDDKPRRFGRRLRAMWEAALPN